MMNRPSLPLLIAALLAFPALRADAGEGKVSGHMFGDYYSVLSADDGEAKLPEKQNAFQLRRVYFTYDSNLSERFDVRFRLEANDAGFGSGSKMVPFVKNAYLKWKGALGGDLYIGESGTPTWKLAETVWGYRSIEKTVLDRNSIGSSADIGLALKGHAGSASYHLMVANGPGQKPEGDNGKKLYASVQLQPGESNRLELYGDLDMLPGGDSFTLKAFAGRMGSGFQGGLEVFTRVDREASASDPGADRTRSGLSAFGSLPVADSWRGFARLDALSNDDADTTDLVVIAGLDWAADKNVHIMPNLYVQLPDGPDPHIQARVTGYIKF
ncbi:MAG: hypothetical protein O2782_00865 [bacterium]|nr:hypothetical protein [bacterium]